MVKKIKKRNKKQTGGSKFPVKYMIPLYALLCGLFAFLLYAKSIDYEFTYLDDNKFASEYLQYVDRPDYLAVPFQTTFGASYYRPMLGMTFLLDAKRGELDPVSYNLTNIFLHVFSSIFIYLLLIKLKFTKNLSLILTLFFAAAPVLTPAVSWVAGRNDSLAAFFLVPSFIFLVMYYDMKGARSYLSLAAHGTLFLAGLFTKEIAVMLPLIAVMYVLAVRKEKFSDRRNFILGAVWIIAALIFLTARMSVSHLLAGEDEVSLSSFIYSLPTIPSLAGKIFFPVNMVGFAGFDSITIIFGLAVLAGLVVLYFFSGENKNLYLTGLLWFVLFILPSLFVRIKYVEDFFDYAEHRAYMPIIGILILLGAFLKSKDINFNSKKILAAGLIIVGLYTAKAYMYQDVFENRFSYWNHAIETHPDKARGYINLAKGYISEGRFDKAIEIQKKAIELSPGNIFLNSDLSYIYLQKEEWEKAAEYAKKTLAKEPEDPIANYNLAKSYARRNLWDKAIEHYRIALENDNRPEWLVDIGRAYFELKEYDKAVRYTESALAHNPSNATALQNLGSVYAVQGHLEKAKEIWERTVMIDPNNFTALNNIIKYHIKNNDIEKARELAQKVVNKGGKLDRQVVAFFNNNTK